MLKIKLVRNKLIKNSVNIWCRTRIRVQFYVMMQQTILTYPNKIINKLIELNIKIPISNI
jgi:hypothetical protein